MKQEFEVLPIKDEMKLNSEERQLYYKKMKDYVLKRKLTNTTSGATTIAPKMKPMVNKIASFLVKKMINKDAEWICDGNKIFPSGAVIFAHSHQGVLDNFVWIPEVDKHGLILHQAEVSKALIISQLYTGLVLVKRSDKQSCSNAKLDMIKLLLEGHSITYFPESTWNLSPNKLHLPLNYGFIDIAKKAQVPIIPVVHEYSYDTSTEKVKITRVHSRYGNPIFVKKEDSLIDKLREYEEAISTIRWELIEEKGMCKRKEISNIDYINFLKFNYQNMKLGKIDVKNENKYIFGNSNEFYKFHHINGIPYSKYGKLLEPNEVRRLKRINSKEMHVANWIK